MPTLEEKRTELFNDLVRQPTNVILSRLDTIEKAKLAVSSMASSLAASITSEDKYEIITQLAKQLAIIRGAQTSDILKFDFNTAANYQAALQFTLPTVLEFGYQIIGLDGNEITLSSTSSAEFYFDNFYLTKDKTGTLGSMINLDDDPVPYLTPQLSGPATEVVDSLFGAQKSTFIRTLTNSPDKKVSPLSSIDIVLSTDGTVATIDEFGLVTNTSGFVYLDEANSIFDYTNDELTLAFSTIPIETNVVVSVSYDYQATSDSISEEFDGTLVSGPTGTITNTGSFDGQTFIFTKTLAEIPVISALSVYQDDVKIIGFNNEGKIVSMAIDQIVSKVVGSVVTLKINSVFNDDNVTLRYDYIKKDLTSATDQVGGFDLSSDTYTATLGNLTVDVDSLVVKIGTTTVATTDFAGVITGTYTTINSGSLGTITGTVTGAGALSLTLAASSGDTIYTESLEGLSVEYNFVDTTSQATWLASYQKLDISNVREDTIFGERPLQIIELNVSGDGVDVAPKLLGTYPLKKKSNDQRIGNLIIVAEGLEINTNWVPIYVKRDGIIDFDVATNQLVSADAATSAFVTDALIGNQLIMYDYNGTTSTPYIITANDSETGTITISGSQNLVTFSEQFDQATSGWDFTSFPVTVTADDIVAPDGTTTADKIDKVSGPSNNLIYQTLQTAVIGEVWTASCYFKEGTASATVFNCFVTGDIEQNTTIDWSTVPPTLTGSTATIEDASDQNLLIFAEQIDDVSWTKTRASITANDIIAPDGTTTADKLVEDSSNDTHFCRQAVAVSLIPDNTVITFLCHLKAGERTDAWVRTQLRDNSSASFYIDLIDGSISTVSPSLTVVVTELPNKWWKVSLSLDVLSGATEPWLQVNPTAGGGNSYQGDGVSGIYFWGAQLNEGSVALTYRKTEATIFDAFGWYRISQSFAASTAGALRWRIWPATRIAADTGDVYVWGAQLNRGATALPYIKTLDADITTTPFPIESSQNYQILSEEFDNASWSKSQSSITANDIIAPDGTTTADKLVEDNTPNITHVVFDNTSITVNQICTVSVFAKADERDVIRLVGWNAAAATNNFNATFDLTSGTIFASTGSGNGIVDSFNIESFPDGWYRCSVSGIADTTGIAIGLAIYLQDTPGNNVYDGDNVSGLHLWGAQLNQGNVVTPYVKTTSTQVNTTEKPIFKYEILDDPEDSTKFSDESFKPLLSWLNPNTNDDLIVSVNSNITSSGLDNTNPDTSSTAIDSSPNGNDGTIVEATLRTGILGNALEFNGADDYVNIGNVSELSFDNIDSWTIESWVKLNSIWDVPNGGAIVSKMDGNSPFIGYSFEIDSERHMQIQIINTVVSGGNRILVESIDLVPVGVWNHLAVSFDGTSASGVKIYLNGILLTKIITFDNLTSSIINSNPVRIGARAGGAFPIYFKGDLDDVRVWTTIRTLSEIQDNMYKELLGTETGLVGYWKFNGNNPFINQNPFRPATDGQHELNQPGILTIDDIFAGNYANMTGGAAFDEWKWSVHNDLKWINSPDPGNDDAQGVGEYYETWEGDSSNDILSTEMTAFIAISLSSTIPATIDSGEVYQYNGTTGILERDQGVGSYIEVANCIYNDVQHAINDTDSTISGNGDVFAIMFTYRKIKELETLRIESGFYEYEDPNVTAAEEALFWDDVESMNALWDTLVTDHATWKAANSATSLEGGGSYATGANPYADIVAVQDNLDTAIDFYSVLFESGTGRKNELESRIGTSIITSGYAKDVFDTMNSAAGNTIGWAKDVITSYSGISALYNNITSIRAKYRFYDDAIED